MEGIKTLKNDDSKGKNVAYCKAYKHGSGVVIPLPKRFRAALDITGGVYLRVELDPQRAALVVQVAP